MEEKGLCKMAPMKAPPKNLSRNHQSVLEVGLWVTVGATAVDRACEGGMLNLRSKHPANTGSNIARQKILVKGHLGKCARYGIVGITKVEACGSRCNNDSNVDQTGVRL